MTHRLTKRDTARQLGALAESLGESADTAHAQGRLDVERAYDHALRQVLAVARELGLDLEDVDRRG